jgi:hypothetical protein
MLLKIKRLLLLRICFNNAKHVSFTSANGRWGPIPDNETETQQELPDLLHIGIAAPLGNAAPPKSVTL